jgi:very-short-patch-repair endonuclease
MRKMCKEEFIKLSEINHNHKYDYSMVDYESSKKNITIICPNHGKFNQTPYSHKRGHGCPKCGGSDKRTTNSFIIEAQKIHNNKYDYSLVNYINNKKEIEIMCLLHGIFKQTPNSHLNKKAGCPRCQNMKKTKFDFITSAIEIHGNLYDYSLLEYKGPHYKTIIICQKHGQFNMSFNAHITKRHGCPFCKESSGESMVKKFLIDKKIDFIYQKGFDNLKYIRHLYFDFYLQKYNAVIEYDGRHHFMPIWEGEDGFEVIKNRDDMKNKYCELNNMILFRIRYDDILENKLNEIYEILKKI